jgi:hypothetical protein
MLMSIEACFHRFDENAANLKSLAMKSGVPLLAWPRGLRYIRAESDAPAYRRTFHVEP